MNKKDIKENIRLREILMQGTFQMEATKNGSEEQLAFFLQGERLNDEQKRYITKVFLLIVENLDNIDNYINKYSKEWTADRIPKTDLAIIRLAICEMLYVKEHPAPIIINDAVNMAKKFSDDDAYKYINGILGNFYRKEVENGNN